MEEVDENVGAAGWGLPQTRPPGHSYLSTQDNLTANENRERGLILSSSGDYEEHEFIHNLLFYRSSLT